MLAVFDTIARIAKYSFFGFGLAWVGLLPLPPLLHATLGRNVDELVLVLVSFMLLAVAARLLWIVADVAGLVCMLFGARPPEPAASL
jgi:apolipoprotein N-acyltransferase